MSDLKVGDVLRLRNARNYLEDGKSWVECKAANGLVLVVQILGVEPQKLTEETALDVTKVMEQLGWVPKKSRVIKRSK